MNKTQIRKENNSKIWAGYLKDADAKAAYKKRFKEIASFYEKESGEAISTIAMSNKAPISDINRLQVNDPLQYAREGTYTQSAYSTNPITGKDEGGFTGWILSQTSQSGGFWSKKMFYKFSTY